MRAAQALQADSKNGFSIAKLFNSIAKSLDKVFNDIDNCHWLNQYAQRRAEQYIPR